MFIKNLEYLKYQHNLNTFKAVYNIGIDIEDDLLKDNSTRGKKSDHPSSSSSEVHATNTSKP